MGEDGSVTSVGNSAEGAVRATAGAAADWTPRQRELVEAAVRVVAASGLRGLTHRAVDAEAGLPEGSCSAYLRTRLALLTALTDYVGGRTQADVAAMQDALESATDAGQTLRPVVDLLQRWALGEPELTRANVELAQEALRRPELRASLLRWRTGLVDIVRSVIASHGHQESVAAARAEAVVAALEGILNASMLQPDSQRAAYLDRTVTIVLRGLQSLDEPDNP